MTLSPPRQITKTPGGSPLKNGVLGQDSIMTRRRCVKPRWCPGASVLNQQIGVGGNTSPPPSASPSGRFYKLIGCDPNIYHRPEPNRTSPGNLEGTMEMRSRPKFQKMLTYFEREDLHLPLSC